MILTYACIIILAVLPIYAGSHASLRRPATAPALGPEEEPEESLVSEGLQSADALFFPLIAGCLLGGLYLLITYVSKEWVNRLLNIYMLFVGFLSNTHGIANLLVHLWPRLGQLPKYSFTAWGKSPENKLMDMKISVLYIFAGILSLIVSASYASDKNWLASNIYGLCFAFNGIELLALDSFKTGMILLSGLFLYDIYFVFGTKIMMTVAQGIDAPIKIVFPRDLLHDFWGPAAMLGLGDIVIPGVYCALSLRYDLYRHHKFNPKAPYKKHKGTFPRTYFKASMAAYMIGLLMTTAVLHFSGAAQPALLYLSPACILSTIGAAWHLNDLQDMWSYREVQPDGAETQAKTAADQKEA